MEIRNLKHRQDFVTMDGSEIRELLAHRNSAIRNQSLAEARLPGPPPPSIITAKPRRFITF